MNKRSPLAKELLFLPGASGNTAFWKPVSDGLDHPGERRFFAWPGFDGVPPDPAIQGIDDLVKRVVAAVAAPVDLLAQSMGGVIALRVALERPDMVQHLVLSVTSGGLDVVSLGALDWRADYRRFYPDVPGWFMDEREDLTARLGELQMPVLLLWGDADPLSPVAVGERLAQLIPNAKLVVISGGTHDLASERAAEVIPYIARHLYND